MAETTSVISTDVREKALVVAVLRRGLDEETTRKLDAEISAAAAEAPGRPIVLDLSKLEFAPSVALGTLVRMAQDFKFFGRRVIVVGVCARVRGAMNVTRIDRILEIRANVADALAQLGAS